LLGSSIAITSGMLAFYNQGSLADDELENIPAHEVGHVTEKHVFRGALVLSWVSITALVGGILWGIGRSKGARAFGLLAVVALIIGGLLTLFSKIVSIITFKFSRYLELRADTFSSIHLGIPSALASGLRKVEVATT
jgi:Zn-dependent protease with chaperone function